MLEPGENRRHWSRAWVMRSAEGRVRVGWKLLAFGCGILVTGIALDVVLKGLNHGIYPTLPFTLGDILVAFLPSWLFLHLEGQPLASLGLRMDLRWFRALGLGFLFACGLMGLAAAGVAFTQGGWVRTSQGPGILLKGFSAYLGVAAFEELLFRGYPFMKLVEAWGARRAQALMAICFVLPHLAAGIGRRDPLPSLIIASSSIGLAALLMGLARLQTGSLALPIGIHLGWNWMQGTVLGLGVSGATPPSLLAPAHAAPGLNWLTGGPYGPEASLPCLMATLIGILLVHHLWPAQNKAIEPSAPPTGHVTSADALG